VPHRISDLRVSDIIDAIQSILEYVEGMTFDEFAKDRKTIDAVVRNFIVIGEAASHLPDDFIDQHPELPWREMRDMRNIMVHEYFGVDNLIIWDTVKKNLPPVLPLLKQLL
jgi:uncharacterized protein with HEPN domain